MIDDLEALYFNDKVHMRSNSANIKKIPKLNFNVVDEKTTKTNQNDQQANNIVVNNPLNKIDEVKKNMKVKIYNLKDYKIKNLENINKDVFGKVESTKNQNSYSFLNGINNTTKNNHANIIIYPNK